MASWRGCFHCDQNVTYCVYRCDSVPLYEIFDENLRDNFYNKLAGASLRSAPLVAWWKNLLPISLYVVLGAGRKQFGILKGFRSVECVPPRH